MSAESTKDFQVRGYAVANAAKYLRQQLGEAEAQRVFDSMSPATRETISSKKPADWAPVSALSELTRAIAAQAGGNDARAQEMLINAGVFMAEEAANTFLRLMLKLITPELFAKKIPSIWSRDFTRGQLTAEAFPNRIVCRTQDMAGFDHAVCTAAGFVTYIFQNMGKKIEGTTLSGWSLSKPCEPGASFELTWQ